MLRINVDLWRLLITVLDGIVQQVLEYLEQLPRVTFD